MNTLERFISEVHARLAVDPTAASADPVGTIERIAFEVGAEWRDRQPLELVEVIDELEKLAPALGPEWATIRSQLRQKHGPP